MDGACSYDFRRRLGLQRTVSGSSSEDGASDYPSFLRPAMALLLSVVVPQFHPYARVCVFFLFVVMPQICPYAWALELV